MRVSRSQKTPSIDMDHMKALHEECIEQLELMKVSLEAAQFASYLMRDKLDAAAAGQWHSYMDMIHLICMHDEMMNDSIKKVGLDITRSITSAEQQYQSKRLLILGLLRALLKRHQRIAYMYDVTGEPTKDYLRDSAPLERERLVDLVEMIHHAI